MYGSTQTRRSGSTKALAVVLALVSLVFLFQITTHGHKDARKDAACRVCQVAHVGVAPAVAAVTLIVPLVVVGEVTAEVVAVAPQDSALHSSPRAPPFSNA